MLDAAMKLYPNSKIEWKPQFNELYVDGELVPVTDDMRRVQEDIYATNRELFWAVREHEATNDAVLKWLVSGNEPIGVKAYRQNLENYFLAVAAGEKPARPVLDDRTAMRKFWQFMNKPIFRQ